MNQSQRLCKKMQKVYLMLRFCRDYRDYPTPDTSNLQMVGTENTEVLLVVRPAAFVCPHKSHQFVLDNMAWTAPSLQVLARTWAKTAPPQLCCRFQETDCRCPRLENHPIKSSPNSAPPDSLTLLTHNKLCQANKWHLEGRLSRTSHTARLQMPHNSIREIWNVFNCRVRLPEHTRRSKANSCWHPAVM